MKLNKSACLIFIMLITFTCILISCSLQENAKKNTFEFLYKGNGYKIKNKFYSGGKGIQATEWWQEDSVLYVAEYDHNGKITMDFRSIEIFPIEDTIGEFDSYQAKIFAYGPIPCEEIHYYISEPISEGESKAGKKAYAIEYLNDSAYFSFDPLPKGNYYYQGAMAFNCDTIYGHKNYTFEGRFVVR